MKRTLSKICSRSGVLLVVIVALLSLLQSCRRDDDAPVYPPYLEKTEVISATEVRFTFDKAIDKGTGEKLSTYTFTPSVEISKAVVEGKIITLTLAKPLNEGNYQITFNGLKSSDGGLFPNGEIPKSITYKTLWKKQANLHVPFANGGDPSTWTFFSLRENKIVTPANPVASTEWDIAFALDGVYMTIYANSECVGVGLPGKGSIGIEEKTIDQIAKVSDEQLARTCGSILAEHRFSANEGYRYGAPWCEKDVDNPFGYAQSDPSIPFRLVKKNSIIFKTADGKYGKLEMQSLYKETPPNPIPAGYDQYYLSFRYVIQDNGTNDVDIPADVQ